MKRHLAGIAFALLIAANFNPAAGQEPVPSSIRSLGPDIVSVTDGGYWSNDAAEGFYRTAVLAVGVEQVSNRLYLQWVANNVEDGTYAVAKSVSVTEINDSGSGGRLIEISRDKGAEFGKLRMKVTVKRQGSDNTLEYRLTADGRPGNYQLTQTK